MILIDAGPLVALVDKGQGPIHDKCVNALKQETGSLITTWPCMTEAMYLLHGLRGWKGQEALCRYVKDSELILHVPESNEWIRVFDLMEQYRDTPMDFADASLVALAESRKVHRIMTLDRDFFVYRISKTKSFDVMLIK